MGNHRKNCSNRTGTINLPASLDFVSTASIFPESIPTESANTSRVVINRAPTDIPALAREAAEKWFAETQAGIDGQRNDPRLLTFNASAQAALDDGITRLATIIESVLTASQREKGEKRKARQA